MTPVASPSEQLPAVLGDVPGQPEAVALLSRTLGAPLHAYLFVGPPGSGKRELARAFAAALVCPSGGCGTCPACRAVLSGTHPDVVVVERQGAAISVRQAEEVAALAQRSPRSSPRQVIVLDEFHLVDEAAPALLKTVEEPPPTTVFLVLADHVPPSLATIASRCVRVEVRALAEPVLVEMLVAGGAEHHVAVAAAAGAGGSIERARLLASDAGFAARQDRWRAIPGRLDGSGATVSVLAAELVEATGELVAVLAERQREELAALEELAERNGDRTIPGRQVVEDRHKREQRRLRTDELRAGLVTLASAYRGRLRPDTPPRELATLTSCLKLIDDVAAALERNPNELLLVQALLLALDQARG